jgi:hypothetical protein
MSKHIAIAAALLLLLASPALAEVGVIYDPIHLTSQGPYELLSIIEDPDPVGIQWRPYSTMNPSRVLLNPEGEANGDGRPSSLYNKISQLPMVAWAKNVATGYDVVISYFENGVWSQPLVLCENATVTLDAEPQLVVNPADGSVHLLYWMDEGSPRIMHRQAPADLSSWSDAVQVSDIGDIAIRPAGVFHQGHLNVVYESHTGQIGGTPRLITLAAEDGGLFSSMVLATTLHDESNRPHIHSSGNNLWVEWIDSDDEMAWTSQVQPDPWSDIEPEPFGSVEERDFHVRREIRGLVLD